MSTATLIGLDFGSTTSGAVIADALLTHNATTGRKELSAYRERFRSEMLFTPFCGTSLDVERLAEYLDGWLAAAQVCAEEVFGGGALLTGLAARADNAIAIANLVRQRLRDALVASADDPRLESWLAFMGNCASLSRAHPDDFILNLDIGGGTTNLALGRGGEVLDTGCLFVGARHFQCQPGTYRITGLSPQARSLLTHLGIGKTLGDSLDPAEVEAVVDFYVRLLHAAASRRQDVFDEVTGRLHQQVELSGPPVCGQPMITLSGGVGALVYAALEGRPLPARTFFGDLGIDLARRLVDTDFLGRLSRKVPPAEHLRRGGRATVYGLLQHSTQISGSTLFLPYPEDLPLADLPVLGTIRADAPSSELGRLIELVRRSARGGCLRLELTDSSPEVIRATGRRLADALRGFVPTHPLVIFVRQNLGKVLGQYITEWGGLPLHLVVVDEISLRNAHYAHLGRMRDQIVPVSVYGLA